MTAADASSLNLWEFVAKAGFIAVIVGVVIEGAELWLRMTHDQSVEDRRRRLTRLGWLILVVGLSAEYLGESKAKRIADRENARLNSESSAARREAGEANARASSNEVARVALELELRKFTAPRTVSAVASNTFISTVKAAPKGSVRIGVNWPDRETQRFALQIRYLLGAAGYEVPTLGNYGEPVEYSHDFDMALVSAEGALLNYSRPLQDAFSDIHFGTIFYTNDTRFKLTTNELLLLIGPKF